MNYLLMQTDIWSLGMILLFLLFSKEPTLIEHIEIKQFTEG